MQLFFFSVNSTIQAHFMSQTDWMLIENIVSLIKAHCFEFLNLLLSFLILLFLLKGELIFQFILVELEEYQLKDSYLYLLHCHNY